jgi:transcriptional regulator with XRE-family HTH domain
MVAAAPTARRRALGARLRELREAAKIRSEDAAKAAETTQATISRLENGKTRVKEMQLRALLELYRCDAETVADIIQKSREAKQKDWWADYDVRPSFQTYIAFETDATEVRTYQMEVIPGLLQTEEYARQTDTRIDNVAVRMARQQRLFTDEGQLHLWAIIEEGALRRAVGGTAILRRQLAHLCQVSDLDTVNIQVIPASVGYHRGLVGAFTILTLPTQEVGYLDGPAGDLYLERTKPVAHLVQHYNLLRGEALSVGRSLALINTIMEEC